LRLVECVPNFSEGRNRETIEAIVGCLRDRRGAYVLDVDSDPDHNRTVVSVVGEPPAVGEAVLRAAGEATRLIDMERHRGAHPRVGATDVVPFVPLLGVTMEDCVELARQVGRSIAEELQVPVYLYAEAATREDRRKLEDVRRGQYEGLKAEITEPHRRPDFGPAKLHPTAGATVVGARKPLVAFNVYLGTGDVGVARRVASAVRESSGGLVNVKAIGLRSGEHVQVSMNLVDFERTPVNRAFELVRIEAARYGADVVGSEIVGLVPVAALTSAAEYYLRLRDFDEDQLLERRLLKLALDGGGPGGER